MLEMMTLSEPAMHHGTGLVASQNHSALGFVFCSIFLDGIGCIFLQENSQTAYPPKGHKAQSSVAS